MSDKTSDKTSDKRLLPCPFCGGEAKIISFLHRYMIGCTKCGGAVMQFNTKEEVITAWNTRTPMERIVDKLKQLTDNYYHYEDDYEEGVYFAYKRAIRLLEEEMK